MNKEEFNNQIRLSLPVLEHYVSKLVTTVDLLKKISHLNGDSLGLSILSGCKELLEVEVKEEVSKVQGAVLARSHTILNEFSGTISPTLQGLKVGAKEWASAHKEEFPTLLTDQGQSAQELKAKLDLTPSSHDDRKWKALLNMCQGQYRSEGKASMRRYFRAS